MGRRQVNLKLDEELLKETEKLVELGFFNNKTEAFTQALKLLIRTYMAEDLKNQIEEVRRETEKLPSVTKAVMEAHEEEG